MNRKFIIKALLSAAMLVFAISFIELEELLRLLQDVSWTGFVLVVFGYAIGQAISAVKWNIILRSAEVVERFSLSLRAYFAGMFVNTFGLGLLGGDLARALLLSRNAHPKVLVLASVVADRTHGLACLALLGTISVALFGGQGVPGELLLLMLGVSLVAPLAWFFGPGLALKFLSETASIRSQISELAKVLPTAPRYILPASFISFSFHFLQIVLHWVLCRAIGADVSFLFLLVSIPFVNILVSLPISWNGLGLRENAYIFFLSPLYLSETQAVLLGGLWLFAVLINSCFGGIVAVVTQDMKVLFSKDTEKPSVVPSALKT